MGTGYLDAPTSRAASLIGDLDPERGLFVHGEWRAGGHGTFDVDDPASGRAIAQVANSSALDARAAVDAAETALGTWSEAAPRDRSDVLMRAYESVVREEGGLAELIAAENGKSITDAQAEVAYAAEFLRWYAEEAVRPVGDFGRAPASNSRIVVTRRPVGVAALVTPWNFPAAMVTRKVAPALAAGCTVVLKPAAETPLTALALVRLLAEAGVPSGVVNLVPGVDADTIVSTWLEDSRVRKLSFTGSTRVGKHLLRKAADRVINTSMELGGCAPFIVTDDADLSAAVDGAMIAKFRNAGQACTAANCFFVHANVAEEFISRLVERVKDLKVGPADTNSDVGPLISHKAVQSLSRLLDEATSSGAQIAHQGELPAGEGSFFAPVVLTDVALNSQLTRTEIFGPLAPIVVWNDLDQLIDALNASEYGLASYVYAGDLQAALQIAERLEVGMVGVNRGMVSEPAAPFGGVKASGIGREGATAGLLEYCETQYLSLPR